MGVGWRHKTSGHSCSQESPSICPDWHEIFKEWTPKSVFKALFTLASWCIAGLNCIGSHWVMLWCSLFSMGKTSAAWSTFLPIKSARTTDGLPMSVWTEPKINVTGLGSCRTVCQDSSWKWSASDTNDKSLDITKLARSYYILLHESRFCSAHA